MSSKKNKTQVAIYGRVSTKNKQEVENQLRELRRWVRKMGYNIYQEYIDN
ncbi:MAG: recombinase family protein, partial [Phycisphaerae bacterium]|nr:recombinase family protein [Phycisphaerae bacterium]NIU55216.1 recombinase family protein [Phycisphaerae bacterium]NIW91894.1 recombinase family protein [Phycisphaerae bacterium]NIX26522.1 recombinase family protein [Phycisphaerae bacterium]